MMIREGRDGKYQKRGRERAMKDWDGSPGFGEIRGNLLLNIFHMGPLWCWGCVSQGAHNRRLQDR